MSTAGLRPISPLATLPALLAPFKLLSPREGLTIIVDKVALFPTFGIECAWKKPLRSEHATKEDKALLREYEQQGCTLSAMAKMLGPKKGRTGDRMGLVELPYSDDASAHCTVLMFVSGIGYILWDPFEYAEPPRALADCAPPLLAGWRSATGNAKPLRFAMGEGAETSHACRQLCYEFVRRMSTDSDRSALLAAVEGAQVLAVGSKKAKKCVWLYAPPRRLGECSSALVLLLLPSQTSDGGRCSPGV